MSMIDFSLEAHVVSLDKRFAMLEGKKGGTLCILFNPFSPFNTGLSFLPGAFTMLRCLGALVW